jgi:hypothetical protein
LPRIYQAFYDAFAGSPQRTIGQQRSGGLPVSLNETGIQTASSDPTYVGWQTGAGAPGGVSGRWATQPYQARWYLAMLNVVACDPNIRLVNIFHLLDDASLGGWQSGLYFADQSPKLSAVTVQNWIATTGESCHGRTLAWRPGTTPTLPPIDLSKLRLPSPPALLPPALAAAGQQTGVGSQADPIPAAVTPAPSLASPAGTTTTDGAQPADTSSTGTTPAGGGASADTTPSESPQPGA